MENAYPAVVTFRRSGRLQLGVELEGQPQDEYVHKWSLMELPGRRCIDDDGSIPVDDLHDHFLNICNQDKSPYPFLRVDVHNRGVDIQRTAVGSMKDVDTSFAEELHDRQVKKPQQI